MNSPSRAIGCAFTLLAALVSAAVSAATVVPDPAEAAQKAREGGPAVVLLQLRITVDGKMPTRSVGPLHTQSSLYVARLDEGLVPQQISRIPSPSKEAGAEGWVYLTLPRGVYFLLVLPPGMEQNPATVVFHADSAKFGRIQYGIGRGAWDIFLRTMILRGTRPSDFREIAGFWFAVPAKTPLVHLGTISASCTGGRGVFGSLIGDCSDLTISGSKEEANRQAQAAFAGLGPVHESKLVLYGKPSTPVRLGEATPFVLSTLQAAALEPVAPTGAQARPVVNIHGTSQAIGVFNVLALAASALSESAAQESAGRTSAELQPCVDKLSAQLSKIDFDEALARAFAAAFGERDAPFVIRADEAAGAGRRPAYELTPFPVRIGLRECVQAGQFCLELALRLSLRYAPSDELIYDGVLLYASDFPAQNPFRHKSRLYERLVDNQAQCRVIDDWCAPEGAALFQKEIMLGIRSIADRFVRDLQVP